MHRRIILLFLMSGSVAAMNRTGVWDAHGNYLGPTPPQIIQQVLVPVPVPMQVPVYLPMQQPMMPFPFNYMQPPVAAQVPYYMQPQMPYHTQPFMPPTVPSFPLPATTLPAQKRPLQNRLVEVPKEEWVTEPHTVTQDSQIVHEDDEVTSITTAMQKVTIATDHLEEKPKHDESQSSSSSISTAASRSSSISFQSWADIQDDDEPVALPASWKKHSVLDEQKSPRSRVALPPTVVEKEGAPSVFISPRTQERKQPSNNQTTGAVDNAAKPQPALPAREISLDQKLDDALRNPTNMHGIINLMRHKIGWLTERCPQRRCVTECSQLLSRLESRLSSCSPAGHQAMLLLDYAEQCVTRADDKDDAIKKGFVDLAAQLITIAQKGKLSDNQRVRVDAVRNRLRSMREIKDVVDNQPDTFTQDFYEEPQAVEVQTVVRSDGKVLYGMVQSKKEKKDLASKKKEKGAITNLQPAVAQELPVATESAQTPQAVPAQSEKKVESAPVAAAATQVKKKEMPKKSDEKIRLILKKNKREKDDVAFLQKAVAQENGIHDDVLKRETLLALGKHYIDNPAGDSRDIKSKYADAKSYLQQAVAGGAQEGLIQLMTIACEENDSAEVNALCDRICNEEAIGEKGKHFAQAHRAIMQLRQDPNNQWTGESLKIFKEITARHSWNNSMKEFADALPEPFYQGMRTELTNWQAKVVASNGAQQTGPQSDTSTCTVTSRAAALDWLYIMGRMHLDGSKPTLKKHQYAAVEWLRTAAASGHMASSLYLASSETPLLTWQRIDYLSRVIKAGESSGLSEDERVYAAFLGERYAMEGHLKPLAHYLSAYHRCQSRPEILDQFLERLRTKFPSLKVEGLFAQTFDSMRSTGLLDELEKRAPDDWVARALVSAFEIAYVTDFLRSDDDGERKIASVLTHLVHSAIQRIEPDVKSHPEVKSIIGAGYATFGMASVLSGMSDQGEQFLKKGVEMGNSAARLWYAYLKLHADEDQSVKNSKKEQSKAVVILEKLADENPDYKLDIYRELADHYCSRQEWAKARDCVERGKQWAQVIHHDNPDEFKESESKIAAQRRDNRNKLQQKLKPSKGIELTTSHSNVPVAPAPVASSSTASSSQAPAIAKFVQEEQKHLELMRAAHDDIKDARDNAGERPFETLRFLERAKQKGIGKVLPDNPELILWYSMAIWDARKKLLDGSFTHAQLVEGGMKALEENIKYIDGALGQFVGTLKAGLNKKLSPDAEKCLMLYWKMRWMWAIQDKPSAEQVAEVNKIIADLPAGEKIVAMLRDREVAAADVYSVTLQALGISLDKAYETYKKSCDGKQIMFYVPVQSKVPEGVDTTSAPQESMPAGVATLVQKPKYSKQEVLEQLTFVRQMQEASDDLKAARNHAGEDPLAALQSLERARDKGIGKILHLNPELMLWYLMAVYDADKKLLDSAFAQQRDAHIQAMEEHGIYLDIAVSRYEAIPKSGSDKKSSPEVEQCLALYKYMRRIAAFKQMPLSERQIDKIKALVAEFPVAGEIIKQLESTPSENVWDVLLAAMGTKLRDYCVAYRQQQGQEPVNLYIPVIPTKTTTS